jgi:small subunit ribosomal protein S26
MLRSINAFGPNFKYLGLQVSNNLKLSPVCVQCVRWKSKPRWLPVAKSKLFRIPVRPKTDESEEIELRRLHNRYRTQMRAVRYVCVLEISRNDV